MCPILYTQRGWTGSDSIDRAFLPGKFKWESSCWWRWFPAGWKKLRKTIRASLETGQNGAITASGFASDILKHGGKHLTAVSLVHARILLHKKGVSGMTAAGDSTHTRKTSPGFLSNPITQLLSTTGEAEGDKHCLQYHLGFKLWIYSRPVCGSAKVSGKRIPLSLLTTQWIFSNLPLNTIHDHPFRWPWLISEWQQE